MYAIFSGAFNTRFISTIIASMPVRDEGLGGITTTINTLAESAKSISRPAMLLSFVVMGLALIVQPAIPDWATQHRGLLSKVILGAIMLMVAPDIVTLIFPS